MRPLMRQARSSPVLISEFHFGSDDRGPFGKGVVSRVASEALSAGRAYATLPRTRPPPTPRSSARTGSTTWIEPVTGRLLDGENAHFGLVGITDIPLRGLSSRRCARPIRELRH
jgi:hypothetical protein